MHKHEAERERLIERICKIEPSHTAGDFEFLSLGELITLLKLAEARHDKQQQRMAASK